MPLTLPRLTAFDPAASSEGSIDPLGLYQIADQLATKLIPAVRERMQRIRFLTAMAVGAVVTQDLDTNPDQPGCPPSLVWEWLVVESLIRTEQQSELGDLWGVPGTLVTRRALESYDYLDARGYLKTPRIFGFHGVYKRLANHLRLVDVHLRPLDCEKLIDSWSKDLGYAGIRDVQPLLDKWRKAVQRGLSHNPSRTKINWKTENWIELAESFHPNGAGRRERKALKNLLQANDDRALGALPKIWELQKGIPDEEYGEEVVHEQLAVILPTERPLLEAIVAYEDFCRGLQDGFDLIRAHAGARDARGFLITSISNKSEFIQSVKNLDERFQRTHSKLHEIDSQVTLLFQDRFKAFAESMDTAEIALKICEHHEQTQERKGTSGKRKWFENLGSGRIYMRHNYRVSKPEIFPKTYVHDYRARPLRNFYKDLNG